MLREFDASFLSYLAGAGPMLALVFNEIIIGYIGSCDMPNSPRGPENAEAAKHWVERC